MQQGLPGKLLSSGSAPSHSALLDTALRASDIAVWQLDIRTRKLVLSDTLFAMIPGLGSIEHEEQLLALMRPSDRAIFQRTFAHDHVAHDDLAHDHLAPNTLETYPAETNPAACEVCLSGLASEPRLRFMGRYQARPGNASCFVGAVVSSEHWLVNPGPEYVQSLLSRLFAESPIASLVTDSEGVVLECNQALEQLFKLSNRQTMSGVGKYQIRRDRSLQGHPELLKRVQRVYQQGEIQTFDLDYALTNLHRNQLFNDQRIPIKVSFLPMRDRHGGVARVLVQCQDRSGEHSAYRELEHRDQLLYSVINNSHNLVSVKALNGRYLMVNHRFGEWFGQEADDICGCSDRDLFPASVAERLREQDRRVLASGEETELEDVLPALDRTAHTFVCVRFPITDADGEIYAIGQIFTDITPQKSIAQSLQGQRQELRLLLDSMRSAVWYFDRWGLMKDFNQLAQELMPRPLQAGDSFLEVAPDWDDPAERQREIMQVIRSGEPQLGSTESAHLHGARCWFSVDKIPTKNSHGDVNGLLMVMTDITQSKIREQALSQSEARYRAFIANSSDAIWRYDLEPPVDVVAPVEDQEHAIVRNARLAEGNRVLAHMFGAPSVESLLGLGLLESGSGTYRFDVRQFVQNGYQLVDHEIFRHDARGSVVHFQISCVGEIEDGHLCRVWGTSKDITARKRYEDRLEFQATHDALTQLPNRTKLYRDIEHWFEHPQDRQSALLLIDLDRFKEINDTLGHQVGDDLLRQIGPRLQSELTELSGLIVRLGGDEFAIFLPDVRHSHQAVVFGHRVLDALRNGFDVGGYATEISASIGIAISPDQAADVSTLMRYADVAMYCAKSDMTGVALYESEKDPHSPKRLAVMNELGRGIRDEQLEVYFQPKIDLAGGRCCGCEALLRWDHPQLGLVSPAEFIPIAEATNLIHPLTRWVLEQSIRACYEWHIQGYPLSVSVNLSARNLLDDTLPRQVEDLLEQYLLPHWALELEITESSIMTDPRRAMTTLERLHELGVTLAIDDFGTGYSSLAYLKRLPVQSLKIDYSFVRQMLADEQDEIIVNSTIHLAHNLGLSVVAEGVESEALMVRLTEMGCDLAQGYHMGRPMPGAMFDQWLLDAGWVERPQASLRLMPLSL